MSCAATEPLLSMRPQDLEPEESRALERHLAGCPACRTLREQALAMDRDLGQAGRDKDLGTPFRGIERPAGIARRRAWGLPAAAAAVLLVGAGIWMRKSRETSAPLAFPSPGSHASLSIASALPAIPGPFAALSETETLAGPCGEVLLAPGSEGRWEAGNLHLVRGTAWVEACGAPLRIFAEGLTGHVEVVEGRVVLQRRETRAVSFGMSSAWADEGTWRIGGEGEAYLVFGTERRKLEGMAGLPGDPRRWQREAAFQLRDAVHAFPLAEGSFVGEILVRKRVRESGADVLFRAGGRGWRLPLGAHLPEGTGWVRLRLETGPGGVRFLAGGREVFRAPVTGLPALLHEEGHAPAFALKAWGGDVEVREARWR